jgi:monoamine oxidase
MASYDCIIVGAGYAGLAAAKALKDAGKNILLIEARDRVGGRCLTQTYDDGLYLDMGGSFLGPHQPRMYKFVKEFGIETFNMHSTGRQVIHYRGRQSSYKGLIPALLPFWALLDMHLLTRKIERMAAAANVDEPWKTANAVELDNITLHEWLRKQCWTKGAREYATIAFELIWGIGTSEVSVLHATVYAKAGVSFTNLATNAGGAQDTLIKGGAQTIANKIRDSLGEAVHLKEPVEKVVQVDGVATVTTSKGSYTASHVIFATPPPQVLRVTFDPPLPHQRRSLLEHFAMGAYWKFMAIYDKPFWREDGYSGESFSPDQVVAMTFDITPEGVTHGVMMCFVVGHIARTMTLRNKDGRQEDVLKALVGFFGEKARNPKKFVEHTMMDEEYLGGCPVGSPAPGMWTTLGPWLRKPFGNIHWAGTETSSVWNGYMEGAVNSGQCAAQEVLELLK